MPERDHGASGERQRVLPIGRDSRIISGARHMLVGEAFGDITKFLYTNTGRSSTLANMHVEGCMTAICLRLLYDIHPMLRPGHWTAHNRTRPLSEDPSLAVDKCEFSLLQPYSTSTRGLEYHGFTTTARRLLTSTRGLKIYGHATSGLGERGYP